jgi:hypothetical protein
VIGLQAVSSTSFPNVRLGIGDVCVTKDRPDWLAVRVRGRAVLFGRASGEMDEVLSHWADGFRLPFRRDICLDEVAGPETRAWTSLYQRIRPKV